MTFVFAMAGASSRFFAAGFKVPKYMLNLGGKTLFHHAVSGFWRYFNESEFIFIYRNLEDTADFIRRECEILGLSNYRAFALNTLTRGQSESVYIALNALKMPKNEPFIVFNIDTFRPNFTLPHDFDLDKIDGYLEVFRSENANFSFVLPAENPPNLAINSAEISSPKNALNLEEISHPKNAVNLAEISHQKNAENSAEISSSKNARNSAEISRSKIIQNSPNFKVAKTAEKELISHFASTGLYYFAKFSDFAAAFENAKCLNLTHKNEFYIAPLYNYLISQNCDIRYCEISHEDVIFCGTPSEYESLKKEFKRK